MAWLRNAAASAGVKRKSAARSSVNWPRARAGGQGERRILTRRDDQVQLVWQMLDQKGEYLVNWCGINHVVIIKDENAMSRQGGGLIE